MKRTAVRHTRECIERITVIILTLTLIVGSCIAICNLVQQSRFNRDSLRPWIGFKPMSNRLKIENGFIFYDIALINTGRSPAQFVETYSSLSYGADSARYYPADSLTWHINKTRSDSAQVYSIVFPNETLWINKSVKIPPSDEYYMLIDSHWVYLHGYLEYLDSGEQRYYLQITYILRRSPRADVIPSLQWTYIHSSADPLPLKR